MLMNGTSNRLASLDALRGVAVLLMVEQHLGNWLWGVPWINPAMLLRHHPLLMTANALGGLAAPAFILLAGMGGALFGARSSAVFKTLVRRGLVLLALGYALNCITPAWFTPGSWYVLHLIGLGLVLAPLSSRIPTRLLVAGAVLILVATPFVQLALGTPLRMNPVFMGDLGRPGGVLRLALAEGYFPMLPWLGVFGLGLAAGRWLLSGRSRLIAVWAAVLGGTAVLLAAIGVLVPGAANGHATHRLLALEPRIYPCFLPLALLLSGAVLGLVLVFSRWEGPRWAALRHVLACLGRCSLTILIVHVFVFRQVAAWLGLYKTLSSTQTGLVLLAVLAVFTLLAVLWSRSGFRYGAEWLLRRISVE